MEDHHGKTGCILEITVLDDSLDDCHVLVAETLDFEKGSFSNVDLKWQGVRKIQRYCVFSRRTRIDKDIFILHRFFCVRLYQNHVLHSDVGRMGKCIEEGRCDRT